MKVMAKGFGDGQCGYYGHIRRYNGDVFEVEDEPKRPETKLADGRPDPLSGLPGHFSPRWMEPVPDSTPVTAPSSVKTRAAERRANLRK